MVWPKVIILSGVHCIAIFLNLGTELYAPPEWILHKHYFGIPATVWSLGILLYTCVCGNIPFKNVKQICKADLKFLPILTLECQNLVKRCLQLRPEDRISIEEILQHRWLTSNLEHTSSAPTQSNVILPMIKEASSLAQLPISFHCGLKIHKTI
jgi:serine/threonine protein kinase